MGFFARGRRDQKRAVRSDRDLSPLRERDMRIEIDGDFPGRDAQPKKNGFEGERRNDFAAIAEKKRDMNVIRNFVWKINEARRGNEAEFFTGLAANSRKLHQLTAFPFHLGKSLDLRPRRIGIGGSR